MSLDGFRRSSITIPSEEWLRKNFCNHSLTETDTETDIDLRRFRNQNLYLKRTAGITRFVDLYLQGLSRVTTHVGPVAHESSCVTAHAWRTTLERFMLEWLPPILRPFLSKISNAHNIMLCFTKVFSAKDQWSDMRVNLSQSYVRHCYCITHCRLAYRRYLNKI